MYPGLHARNTPDKPAVVLAESGDVVTYRQLDDNSAALARALRDAGLRPGDVVAVLSDNAAEVFDVYWAAHRSGLYITAINHHLTAGEVAYIVNDSGARALIVSAELREMAGEVVGQIATLDVLLAFGGAVPGFGCYEDALATAGPPLADEPCGAVMLYSSGTTGFPKGVKPPLPQRRVDEAGDPIVAIASGVFGMTASDIYLSPAPIYHAAPLRWCGMIQALGGTAVIMKKFDAESALKYIERYHVTAAQMVPTMLVRLLKLDDSIRNRYDLSSLRVLIHAAAPCPVDVKQAMIEWVGPILYEYYSSTEAHGMTFIDSKDWLRHPGSVGRSVLGVLHICDDDGVELPTGAVGTVYFERDQLPFEYHNDSSKTAEAQHPAHPSWTTVGDLGYVDAEGYLYLADRKSFMIISGGVNIYPQEIESALALHPVVDDVAVIGVPHEEMGEEVKAIVQLSAGLKGSDVVAKELIDHVRSRMAAFKAPRSVDFVDQLPRTPTGKLLKNKLKEQFQPGAAPGEGK